MKKILLSLCFCSLISAQQPNEGIKTPAQIQAEIDQAQRDFEIAKKMFIPWYTGPLITASSNNAPPGKYVLQPYLFNNWQYATFNADRKSESIPDIYTLQPLLLGQTGITDWLDITVTATGFFKWQKSQHGSGWGDTAVSFGLQLYKETLYVPSFRLTVGESFPTGRYQKLNRNKNGLDATGSGAYTTVIGLIAGKVFWWLPLHPVSVRLASNYNFPNHKVSVRNFNAYGGGFGTDGRVTVGHTMNFDLGIEVSITQKWVFATDFAYTYTWPSLFSGRPGIDAMGMAASVGTPTSNQFSLSPAIEYNRTSTDGFIGGVWFSATGKSSPNFAALVLSYYILF